MAEETGKTVRAFKGFDKDLKCRGFQYEIDKEYEIEGDVKCCGNGFHACENPFDVFCFYPIIDDEGNLNRFCEVEGSGEADKNYEKTAFSKLKVKSEIGIKGFISAFIKIVKESVKTEKDDSDSAKIGSSGDYAQIGSSDDYAQIGSSGDCAQIGSSGDSAQIGSSGDSAQIGSSGDYAKIGSSGNYAQIGSSGDSAKIGSSGDSAKIGSSGDYAQISSEGKHSVICCSGSNCKAKAKKGSWITLSEWKYDENEKQYIPVCVKTEFVDGEKIKEDTFYILKDGEFKEVINE